MLRRIGLAVVVLALGCPAAASAGGFATVGLQSLPTDVEPGKPWMAEFTVLSHGRTPFLEGHPEVIVSGAGGEVVGTFPARLVNDDGLYRAAVVFPSRGRFEYVIDDGYAGQRHSFPPVLVGGEGADPAPAPAPASPAAPAADDGGSPALAVALAAGAGLLTALLVLVLRRRRSQGGEPALGA